MSVTFGEPQLKELKNLLKRSLQNSFIEYERIFRGVKNKHPELVKTLLKHTVGGEPWSNDGSPGSDFTFACSYYETAHGEADDCVRAFHEGRAEASTIIRAHLADANLYRGLGLMLLVLNGGTLSESYIAQLMEERAQTDKTLQDIQQTFDSLRRKSGKSPSQREVAEESGYARETVRSRWGLLRK